MVVKLKAHVFWGANSNRLRHARLGLADTKDQVFDSVLFLESHVFTSSTP
jgi:hypothetical protein